MSVCQGPHARRLQVCTGCLAVIHGLNSTSLKITLCVDIVWLSNCGNRIRCRSANGKQTRTPLTHANWPERPPPPPPGALPPGAALLSMLAVRPPPQWGSLPAPSYCFALKAVERPAFAALAAGNAIDWCSPPDRAALVIRQSSVPCSSKACLRASGPSCRSSPRQLTAAMTGDGGNAVQNAVMVSADAAPDEGREGRLQDLRDLERALDPEAAQAAELRRRHREAVEPARRGDPEEALARLQTLLVSCSDHPLPDYRSAPSCALMLLRSSGGLCSGSSRCGCLLYCCLTSNDRQRGQWLQRLL